MDASSSKRNGSVISKASKRNMRKKLSRHAKKAKLEEGRNNQINEKLTTTPDTRDGIRDNQDDQDYDDDERPEIFYNLEKVS